MFKFVLLYIQIFTINRWTLALSGFGITANASLSTLDIGCDVGTGGMGSVLIRDEQLQRTVKILEYGAWVAIFNKLLILQYIYCSSLNYSQKLSKN